MLRAFSHKINFNFHIFIRPKHTILLAANVRRRRREVSPLRSGKESTGRMRPYTDAMTASLCKDTCVGCSLGLFFASLWVCVAAWGLYTDKQVGWGHGWAERRWENKVMWELRAILSQRNKFTSSVSSSSCSASDPHTHCPSTDLYTPNYTQQPPDSIHISPHMQKPKNTHIRKAAASKPDQLCLCLSSCQARN